MTEKQDPSHFPLVTIGIPAFNSARHVRRSIESLVGQDYPNLQIVISDDGSTDETASICDEMAMTDPRIEVHRRTHLGSATTSTRSWRPHAGRTSCGRPTTTCGTADTSRPALPLWSYIRRPSWRAHTRCSYVKTAQNSA